MSRGTGTVQASIIKRYRRLADPLSFVIGLAFVAIAGGLSMAGVDLPSDDLRWLGAGLLYVLGIVLLTGAKADR